VTVEVWIGVIGISIGLLGFVLAIFEHQSKRRVVTMIRTNLMAAIQRTRTLVLRKAHRQELIEAATTDELKALIATVHRGNADLYVDLVTLYLNHCRKFTYKDLGKMVANKAIRTRWQEGIWRSLITRRPENAKVPVPEWFLPPPET